MKQKNPHSFTEISIESHMETATAGDMHSYPGSEPEPGVAQLPDSVPGSPVTPVTKKAKLNLQSPNCKTTLLKEPNTGKQQASYNTNKEKYSF